MSLSSMIDVTLPRVEVNLGVEEGTFSVAMGVWSDETYSAPLTGNLEFVVPQDIHFGIVLENDPPAAFKTQLKKCWATPR